MLSGWPPWLLVEGAPKPLRLPLRSRNPGRLASMLSPARLRSPVEGLAWLLCVGVECFYCIWPPGRYEVSSKRGLGRDRLSGLRHEIIVEVRGLIDGETVWLASWRGDALSLEAFDCRARVYPDGSVVCGSSRCRGAGCLRECLEPSTRGP